MSFMLCIELGTNFLELNNKKICFIIISEIAEFESTYIKIMDLYMTFLFLRKFKMIKISWCER